MNPNDHTTETNLSQYPDNQGRLYELLSPTQVLTGQVQPQQQHQQQQQEQQQGIQKKKCRGNQKMQRYRRQLRARGLDPATVTRLANEKLYHKTQKQNQVVYEMETQSSSPNQVLPPVENRNATDNEQETTLKRAEKRKRNEATNPPTTAAAAQAATLERPLSQLSISQPSPKKKKREEKRDDSTNQNVTNTTNNQAPISKKDSMYNLPDYLKVSNRIFKQMLTNSLEGAETFVKTLNSPTKVKFVRQYACLTHRLFYVQFQEEQWNYYYQKGTKENVWSGRVSKKWAKINSMHHTYGRSKQLVERRCNTIKRQLDEVSSALIEFGAQPPKWITETDPPFDIETMSIVVTAFVRKGQHKLRRQFEHEKRMLSFDSKDHCLVQAVYDLKPNKQQSRSTRTIWEAIYKQKDMEEQVEILKYRLHSHCLPPAYNLLDHSIDKVEKMLARSRSAAIDKNTRMTLSSRRSKKIGQFKYEMIELTIATGEEIVRSFGKVVKNEKKKMLLNANVDGDHRRSKEFAQLMAAIEARVTHMIERANYITKQKVDSFFDEAPATHNNNNETDNAVVVGANL